MEPDLPSSFGSASHEVSSERIEVATSLLNGLTIRADEVAGPLALVFLATTKQWFQIPLKTIFINALKSVGIAEPVFSVLHREGCFQVTIHFASNIPIRILGSSKHANIVGEFARTYELAESYAIDKAFVHLREVHNLRVVDISARKEKSLILTSRKLYTNTIDVLGVVAYLLRKWENCLHNLGEVQCFAFPKLTHVHTDESHFAEPVYNSLNHIKRVSMEKIREFHGMMKCVSDEKDKYVEASRAKEDLTFRACGKKAYFDDVNALDLLCKFLNLEGCYYSAKLGDDGLYLGTVMLSFAPHQTTVLAEQTCIEAKAVKRTIAKAKNAAARAAISELEDHFNVEVSGYNHIAKVEAEQEMYVWKGINNETRMLAANVLNIWEHMFQTLQEYIGLQKNKCSMLASRAVVGNEMVFIYDLVQRLELAASKCRKTFEVAAAKLNSLIEQ